LLCFTIKQGSFRSSASVHWLDWVIHCYWD